VISFRATACLRATAQPKEYPVISQMAAKTELKAIVSLRAMARLKATARLRATAQPEKLLVISQRAAKT
jgi:hypothetical protein